MIQVDVANRQDLLTLDRSRLVEAVRAVLHAGGVTKATVSVAIVDDPEIHRLNRVHLQHDYPTDVLSFLLDDADGVDGEIVVSAETALISAARYGWSPFDELLYYVVHGALHLIGYDDQTPDALSLMREREDQILAQLGHPEIKRDA